MVLFENKALLEMIFKQGFVRVLH